MGYARGLFLTNEIINANIGYYDAQIRVIDVGDSYNRTCELNNGQYIKFNKESKLCINPFSFIELKLEENVEYDLSNISKEALLNFEDLDDQVTMLKSIFLVSAGISEDDGRYTISESYFEQAIVNSLRKYQNKSTYTTVYDELIALSQSENTQLAKDLADSIKSYTKHGIFGKYFEGESNLNINNPFFVLELEELATKGNLKFIVLLIIMLKITQDMYLSERKRKKICIIDEAWDLMSGGNTSKFIVTGYRRARKYNGSFITITQKIDDYFAQPATQACYDNAAIKISMQQEESRSVKMEPYLVEWLKQVKSIAGVYSEFIYQNGKTATVCRFVPDEFSQMLYSTRPPVTVGGFL